MRKEKVFLKKKDFDVVNGNYIDNYTEHDDCPLARACKRHFDTENISVNAFDNGVEIDGILWTNTNEWDSNIARRVGKCIHDKGNDIKYYVTLTLK